MLNIFKAILHFNVDIKMKRKQEVKNKNDI